MTKEEIDKLLEQYAESPKYLLGLENFKKGPEPKTVEECMAEIKRVEDHIKKLIDKLQGVHK